jgi:hypothetical protein
VCLLVFPPDSDSQVHPTGPRQEHAGNEVARGEVTLGHLQLASARGRRDHVVTAWIGDPLI